MYAPAGNTTVNFSTHLATVYYNRVAEDAIREKQTFWKLVEDRRIPLNNGKTVQFYRYTNLGADSTPVATTEGAVGTGLEFASGTFSATVSQYADWASLSDLLIDTSISDEVANAADQMGYRAAVTANNVLKNEIDNSAASFSLDPLSGSTFSSKDGLHVFSLMTGLNIRPMRSGYFEALIHPYVAYDFLADPSAGGFQDVVKRGGQGNQRLFTREDRGLLAIKDGVRYWEATDVTATGDSPNKWRVYFAGMGGVAAVDLAGRGPQRTMDHSTSKFRVNVLRPGPSAADPAGKIAAYIAYKYTFAAKILDSTNYRLRKIDANSGIVS